MAHPYTRPLPPIREQGLYVEFPERPPEEVRAQLHNCGWRYANRRWWYKGAMGRDAAVEDLERTLARYGETVEEHGGEYGWVDSSEEDLRL